jgi:hypothetical protein
MNADSNTTTTAKGRAAAAQVPKGRKVAALTSGQLVISQRALLRELAVLKLTNKPFKSTEIYLTSVEAELKKRGITINHPEMK